jgi:hypothetical protein
MIVDEKKKKFQISEIMNLFLHFAKFEKYFKKCYGSIFAQTWL